MRSSFTEWRGEVCKQFNQIQRKKTKLSDLLLVVEMSKYISIVINKIKHHTCIKREILTMEDFKVYKLNIRIKLKFNITRKKIDNWTKKWEKYRIELVQRLEYFSSVLKMSSMLLKMRRFIMGNRFRAIDWHKRQRINK